jgi:Flp pilus assembly protein TadD
MVVLALFAGVAQGLAGSPDEAKLRGALSLPPVNLRYGLSLHCGSRGEWFLESDEGELYDRISRLQRSLRGNDDDAEVYSCMGDLYREVEQSDKAKAAYREATRLYRKLIEARPTESGLLARLGWVLLGAAEDRSAEEVLRKATRLAPGEWLGWAALAAVYRDKAIELIGQGSWKSLTMGGRAAEKALTESLRSRPPTPDAIRRAESLMAESWECCNKAVAAAPRKSAPYYLRGLNRLTLKVMDRSLRSLSGEGSQPLGGDPVKEFLNDCNLAARNCPQDSAAVAGPVVALACRFEGENYSFGPHHRSWESLPKEVQRAGEEARKRLRVLADSADPPSAARASEILGVLQLLAGDLSDAADTFREAVELDPTRKGAWDNLMALCCALNKTHYLLHFSAVRLGYDSSAGNYFLYAKACEGCDNNDRAEKILRKAVKTYPDNFLLTLGLAIQVLKRAKQKALLDEAKGLLDTAEKLLPQATSSRQRIQYAMARSVCLALVGDITGAKKVLRLYSEDETDGERVRLLLDLLK